jgi:Protein of unknown function (DUF3224)
MVFLVLVASCLSTPLARAQNSSLPATQKGSGMTLHAKGTFDVKVAPVAEDKADGSTLGRYSLDKQYPGDLEATAKGEMLTAGTSVKGSAGYVAIERVTGTLAGRKGSFVLQHTGTMNRGTPTLTVSVVPDSGTDELAGITGTLTIIIADGKHSYDLEYSLPESH